MLMNSDNLIFYQHTNFVIGHNKNGIKSLEI